MSFSSRGECYCITYPERLLETPVVGNVLALCQSSINGQVYLIQCIIGVLIHDALGSATKFGYGTIVPPLLQIAVLVKLPSCNFQYNFQLLKFLSRFLITLVVKAVRYFMTNNDPNSAVI